MTREGSHCWLSDLQLPAIATEHAGRSCPLMSRTCTQPHRVLKVLQEPHCAGRLALQQKLFDASVALQVETVPAPAAKEAAADESHSQKVPLQQQRQQPQQKRAIVPGHTGSDGLPRGSARQQRETPSVVQRPAQQDPSPAKVGALTLLTMFSSNGDPHLPRWAAAELGI